MLLLGRLADIDRLVGRREALRRVDVRGREHGLLPQDADARVGELRFVGPDALGSLLLAFRLRVAASLDGIRVEDVGSGVQEAGSLLDRERAEHAAIAGDRLEQLGCYPQPLGRVGLCGRKRLLDPVSTSPGRVSGGRLLNDSTTLQGSDGSRPSR